MTNDRQFTAALSALHGLGQLLACVDPQRWASLGRPAASDLATLIFTIHADLAQGATDEPPG